VDATQVSMFCAQQMLILSAVLNLVFGLIFLVRILGWLR